MARLACIQTLELPGVVVGDKFMQVKYMLWVLVLYSNARALGPCIAMDAHVDAVSSYAMSHAHAHLPVQADAVDTNAHMLLQLLLRASQLVLLLPCLQPETLLCCCACCCSYWVHAQAGFMPTTMLL